MDQGIEDLRSEFWLKGWVSFNIINNARLVSEWADGCGGGAQGSVAI